MGDAIGDDVVMSSCRQRPIRRRATSVSAQEGRDLPRHDRRTGHQAGDFRWRGDARDGGRQQPLTSPGTLHVEADHGRAAAAQPVRISHLAPHGCMSPENHTPSRSVSRQVRCGTDHLAAVLSGPELSTVAFEAEQDILTKGMESLHDGDRGAVSGSALARLPFARQFFRPAGGAEPDKHITKHA